MALLRRTGLKPNKLTNIWVPFVVGATEHVAVGGRLALVIPAEVLQVSYAAQLRRYLVDNFERIEVIGCNELIFDGAEQEVVLFLAEGKLSQASANNVCHVDLTSFPSVSSLLAEDPFEVLRKRAPKDVRHETEKWLKYFLSPYEIGLMRELRASKSITNFGSVAQVDVGVVTGNNDFFVVSRPLAEGFGLQSSVVPIVGRSSHLRGAIFRERDHAALSAAGDRVFLFSSLSRGLRLKASLRAYVRQAEKNGTHLGYKCSIRDPWYSVPSVWTPTAFMFRQIHDFPRLIANRTQAASTDTIHRVRIQGDVKKTISSFFTHLTAASAEIEGRSYGGGVLELEPTEAEHLLVPRGCEGAVPLEELDVRLRKGALLEVLADNDRRVLRNSLGLTLRECQALKLIWEKMRERRSTRRKLRA